MNPKTAPAATSSRMMIAGCRSTAWLWIRGTSRLFSSCCTMTKSSATHRIFSGSPLAAAISSAGSAPIHGPMIGISSVMPAKIASAIDSSTSISVSPANVRTPTTAPRISCPRR